MPIISFMTFTKMTGSVRVRVVRFTRETTVKNGNVYDVDVLPDGTEQYSINSRSVEILPDLPSTQELMLEVERHKESALELLSQERDTPEWRRAWWALKDAIRALR